MHCFGVTPCWREHEGRAHLRPKDKSMPVLDSESTRAREEHGSAEDNQREGGRATSADPERQEFNLMRHFCDPARHTNWTTHLD
jgi:hypothetical protein